MMNGAPVDISNFVVATWNMEWAPPTSTRAQIMASMLKAREPDVICLTEVFVGHLPDGGEIIESAADYGYPIREGRRKVLLWTRHQWQDIDCEGHLDMPTGRFAAGTVLSPNGQLRIVGVCVPWAAAHVATGRKDRVRWEDHSRYLAALGPYLRKNTDRPTILLGDFNQTIPRSRQPIDVFRALNEEVMGAGFRAASADIRADTGELLIDHLFCSEGVLVEENWQLPRVLDDVRLSDHTGFGARVSLCPNALQ